jgi:RNA polymerase-binding transcription factor DksA
MKKNQAQGGGSRTEPARRAARGFLPANAVDLQNAISPKWVRHYRTLLSLREKLLKERKERLNVACEPLETHSMSVADSATDEFDHNLALAALSSEQEALNEVEQAIRRILDGTYGICEATGRRIAPARLKAIPWARFALEPEREIESRREVREPCLGELGSVRQAPAGTLEDSDAPAEGQETIAADESMSLIELPVTHNPKRHRTS